MPRSREISVIETPMTFSNKQGGFFRTSALHARELLLHFPAKYKNR